MTTQTQGAAPTLTDWGVTVEFPGVPSEPYRSLGAPLDPRVKLISMGTCAGKRTRIHAKVSAVSMGEARELGEAEVRRYGRVLNLPDEPTDVTLSL